MKISNFSFFLLMFLFLLAGCSGNDVKEDAKKIGDAMCRNIDVMHRLKMANPADEEQVAKLQEEINAINAEMEILYKEFNTRWGEKTKDKEFARSFRVELRKAMLECKSLSAEDREVFLKEIGE